MIRARCYKSIRRAGRARIFASESWTRQYKRARGGWQYYVLMTLGFIFIPFFVLVGLIGLPVAGGLQIAQGQGELPELIGFLVALLLSLIHI